VLGGGLKWKAVQIPPNESQFLETRKLNTEQVARIWRVPPHMIGAISDHASQGGGKGLEEQGIGYAVFTLGAYLFRLEAALSSTKISPRGQYAKFNVGGLLRGNTRDRYAAYAIARQWGWLSVNDIRALEDLAPIDDGDAYLQPLNMVDAQKALEVLLNDTNTGGVA
jgi:HK97 family phage portal protein